MKPKKVIKRISIIVVFVFLFTYIVEMTGYYEYSLHNQKTLTEEQMQQFETDVKEGKEIDINTYLKDTTVDYSNSLTRTTSDVSLKLNDYLKDILSGTFQLVGKLFE